MGGNPVGYKSNGMVISRYQHFGGMFTANASARVTFTDPKFFYQVGTSVTNGPTQGDIVAWLPLER